MGFLVLGVLETLFIMTSALSKLGRMSIKKTEQITDPYTTVSTLVSK